MPPKKNLQQLMAERHEAFLEMMTAFHQDLRKVVTTTVETAMQTALQVGNQGRVQHQADRVQHQPGRVQHQADRVQHQAGRVQHQFERQNLEDLHQGDNGAAFQNRVEVRQPRGEIVVHRGDSQQRESSFRFDLPDDEVLDGVAELFAEEQVEDDTDDEVLDGVAELFAEEQVEGATGHMLQKNKPPDPPDFSRFGHVPSMNEQSLQEVESIRKTDLIQEEEMFQDKDNFPDQVLCQTKAPPCLQPQVLISYSDLVKIGREKSDDKAELDEYGTGVGVETLFVHVQDMIVLHQKSSNGISCCVNQLCDAIFRSHGYRLTTKCSKSWRFKFKYSLKSDQLYCTVDDNYKEFKYRKLQQTQSKRKCVPSPVSDTKMIKLYRACVMDTGNNVNTDSSLKKQFHNSAGSPDVLNLKKGNSSAMYNYFFRMQLTNPNFFYLMDVNNEGQLRNVFWADAFSKVSCSFFGDVIFIDISYISGKFEIPLVTFTGVNNHGQTTLLGYGLLAGETMESYHWLLKVWLGVMKCSPQTIITDRCKPLEAVISQEFPSSHHRYSLTHIMRKIPEKLGGLHNYDGVRREFTKAVYKTLKVVEFEAAWGFMVHNFGVIDNEWLRSLYEDRAKWAPVYLKNTFFAGIAAAHPIETLNPIFERYVHKQTPLKEFIDKYELALQKKHKEESLSDIASLSLNTAKLKTKCSFETQISRIYTRDMFKQFQVEVEEMYSCFSTTQLHIDGSFVIFLVRERVPGESNRREIRDFEVLYNRSVGEVRCICSCFNFYGYLCRHALCVLNFNGVEEIPSRYILPRWRKDYKRVHNVDNGSTSCVDVTDRVQWFDQLFKNALQVVEEGTVSLDHYTVAMHAPFLIPFTSRVNIFTTPLATERENPRSQGIFARSRFRIRRDHILEDAYNQMSALSENDLRGSIRVTIVTELVVEEAGIDGGGIFKDLNAFLAINRSYGFWTDGGNKKKLMNIQDDPKKKKMGLMRVNEKMTPHEPHDTREVKSVMQELNWSGAKNDAHVLENCQGDSLWVFVKRHEVIVEAVMTLYKKVTFDHYLRHLEKNYTLSIIRTEDVFTVTTVTTFTVIQSNGYLVSILFYEVFHPSRPPELKI